MSRLRKQLTIIVTAAAASALVVFPTAAHAERAAPSVPLPGAIKNVLVIDLENEGFEATYGASSPAHYLNDVLVPQGELLTQYFATGHASTDDYLAQISGQAPNHVSGNDCITNTTTLASTYTDVTPGTPTADQATYLGQVDGAGCVYPAAVQTIASQLDVLPGAQDQSGGLARRQYAEDMGNDAGDFGTSDPLGGTDCAHPALGVGRSCAAILLSSSAAATSAEAARWPAGWGSLISRPARRVGSGGAVAPSCCTAAAVARICLR